MENTNKVDFTNLAPSISTTNLTLKAAYRLTVIESPGNTRIIDYENYETAFRAFNNANRWFSSVCLSRYLDLVFQGEPYIAIYEITRQMYDNWKGVQPLLETIDLALLFSIKDKLGVQAYIESKSALSTLKTQIPAFEYSKT